MAKKAATRKRPLNNKGTKRHPSGRHSLAKELKAHNKYMPHGYEVRIHIAKKK